MGAERPTDLCTQRQRGIRRPVGRPTGPLCQSFTMDSFYIGPGKPWLQAGSWDDLIAAAQVGNLLETQWCESKLAVPASSTRANDELAKDLASLSVDGGVLLIGIRD